MIPGFHNACLPQHGFHGSRVGVGKGITQVEGGGVTGIQLVEAQHVVAVAADGRQAGRRPPLEKRIEIGFRINPQGNNAQWMVRLRLVEDGHHQCQINLLVLLVPVKILEGHLAGAQDFRNTL